VRKTQACCFCRNACVEHATRPLGNEHINLWPSSVKTRIARGVTRGAKGTQFSGRRMTAGGAEKSKQYHKHFLQCSTFASESPQVRTWGGQTCPNFPKIARKTFMRQTFSVQFSVSVGALYFPLHCCHRLQNKNFYFTITQLWHVSNYSYYDYVESLTTLCVQLHIYGMQPATNCMAKCIHPNTVVKAKAFLCLPSMDSTNVK